MNDESLDVLPPSSDERMMAALAHFFGIIGSLLVYAMQKDKSRFVRFQAAQALAFDFTVMVVTFVLFFCLFGVLFIGMFGTVFAGLSSVSQSDDFRWFLAFPILLPSLLFSCIFPISFALFIVRVVASVSVLSGSNFRYPFLGAKVQQFLDS